MDCLKKRLLKTLFVFVQSSLLLTGCIQNEKEPKEFQVFAFNGGRAFLVRDNIAFTAYHCCSEEDKILHSFMDIDFAIISTEKVITEPQGSFHSVQYGSSIFKDSSYLAKPGDSGSPFIEDDILKGVYIGFMNGESIITPIPEEAKKYLIGKED